MRCGGAAVFMVILLKPSVLVMLRKLNLGEGVGGKREEEKRFPSDHVKFHRCSAAQ